MYDIKSVGKKAVQLLLISSLATSQIGCNLFRFLKEMGDVYTIDIAYTSNGEQRVAELKHDMNTPGEKEFVAHYLEHPEVIDDLTANVSPQNVDKLHEHMGFGNFYGVGKLLKDDKNFQKYISSGQARRDGIELTLDYNPAGTAVGVLAIGVVGYGIANVVGGSGAGGAKETPVAFGGTL